MFIIKVIVMKFCGMRAKSAPTKLQTISHTMNCFMVNDVTPFCFDICTIHIVYLPGVFKRLDC